MNDLQGESSESNTATSSIVRPIRRHLNEYVADLQANAFYGNVHEYRINSNTYSISTRSCVSSSFSSFVERLFSVCGMLTRGRRNRMDKSLSMRVWLKVNHVVATLKECNEVSSLILDGR